MATNKVYKIRNPDGLFSTGGSYPRFTKVGKSWTKLAYVDSHLRGLGSGYARPRYNGCVVVEYEFVATEVSTTPVTALMDRLTAARVDREKKADELRQQRQLNIQRQEYERLRHIFEPKGK